MKSTNNGIALFTLFLIIFIDLMGIGLVIPVLAPLFLNDSGPLAELWTAGTRGILLGILLGIYPLTQFIGAPILGKLSDKHGRKPILAISLAGTAFGYLLFAFGLFTQQWYLLFLARAIDGFSGGNIGVANSAIADLSPSDKDKAKNFGLVGAAFGLGFIFGPFLGGILSDSSISPLFRAETPYLFAALLSLTSFFLLIFKFKETLKISIYTRISIMSGFQNILKARRLPHLRALFFVAFLHGLGFSFFTSFFPVFLVQKFQLTGSEIGLLYAYIGFWIAISQGLISRFAANFWSSEKILNFALPLLAMFIAALLLPTKVWGILLVQPLIAIMEGLVFPNTTALISKISTPEEQGEILGITQSMRALADGFPPILAGFLIIADTQLPITISALLLLGTWLVFKIKAQV